MPCNRGCNATGIVTIVRLAIDAPMQLMLNCMRHAVVLATTTGLRPTSYTWCLHSDQRYTVVNCEDVRVPLAQNVLRLDAPRSLGCPTRTIIVGSENLGGAKVSKSTASSRFDIRTGTGSTTV